MEQTNYTSVFKPFRLCEARTDKFVESYSNFEEYHMLVCQLVNHLFHRKIGFYIIEIWICSYFRTYLFG